MLTIDPRFCGPSNSANGGYICGLAAAQISDGQGAAEVTLRSPPPLATPIEVERSTDRVLLRDREQLVAEAVRTTLTLEPALPVSFDEATQAAHGYPWFEGHPFPRCFVCGPERAEGDGLRIFPGAVAGRDVAAAPWVPAASVAESDGQVKPEIVWAALDCPSWFGMSCFHASEGRPLLGRLAVEIYQRPQVGERCVCVGWFVGRDGRKVHVGSALYAESGALRALGRATWIVVP